MLKTSYSDSFTVLKVNDPVPAFLLDVNADPDPEQGQAFQTKYLKILSREPRKRRPKHARIAPPCRLNWPCVSDLQSIYKAESWQRAVTLGDSTPQ
jgi:hypothetical protein